MIAQSSVESCHAPKSVLRNEATLCGRDCLKQEVKEVRTMAGKGRGGKGRPWTPSEDKKLLEMRSREDYDWRVIATKLQRSRDACKCRYKVKHLNGRAE